YQVTLGANLVYLSADARYAVQGSIIDLKTRTNLTDAARAELRRRALAAIPEDQMIVFAPRNPKHTITVFTDIDCGYCRKLHSQIQDYMKQGIKVRYLFYPRAGLGSESARKAEAVWCADDRRKAITLAKQGKPIEMKTCENPVAHDFKLGQELGVTGTPAIITEQGDLIPGYIPPQRLRQILDQLKAASPGVQG
ncbi:MAG: DsbC family protein, partial [Gammaproteobacteria bacterium]